MLRNNSAGHVLLVQVGKSDKVHSVTDGGIWKRLDASNRQMSASEVTELSYQRGIRSAENEVLQIDFSLLQTNTWLSFLSARGLKNGGFIDQLERIGLASKVEGRMLPTRAAVLLFADEPGSLLAAHDSRADIRLMIYDGKQVVPGSTPNLRKAPKTIRGPLIEQIDTVL
jgi:ATP-dependent DNA helicase RecG